RVVPLRPHGLDGPAGGGRLGGDRPDDVPLLNHRDAVHGLGGGHVERPQRRAEAGRAEPRARQPARPVDVAGVDSRPGPHRGPAATSAESAVRLSCPTSTFPVNAVIMSLASMWSHTPPVADQASGTAPGGTTTTSPGGRTSKKSRSPVRVRSHGRWGRPSTAGA